VSIASEQVDSYIPDNGYIFSGHSAGCPGAVFIHNCILYPMQSVFYSPMISDMIGEKRGVIGLYIAYKISGFMALFTFLADITFHPDKPSESCPFSRNTTDIFIDKDLPDFCASSCLSRLGE